MSTRTLRIQRDDPLEEATKVYDPRREKRSPAGTAVVSEDSEELLGLVLRDRYKIDLLISKGSFGSVYRGTNILTKKPVAVKVLPRGGSSERVERKSLQELSHPNVVSFIDEVRRGDNTFLILEYFEQDLQEFIDGRQRLKWAETKKVLSDVLSALKCSHRASIVHRDVKPRNCVCIFRDGELFTVKLIDFGIARTRGSTGATFRCYGTEGYISPEARSGGEVDGRADLYAVGVMAITMLTGACPSGVMAEATSLNDIYEEYTGYSELVEYIGKLVAYEPCDRFASADAAYKALKSIVLEEPKVEFTASHHPSGARARTSRVAVAAYVMAAVSVFVGLALVPSSLFAVPRTGMEVTAQTLEVRDDAGVLSPPVIQTVKIPKLEYEGERRRGVLRTPDVTIPVPSKSTLRNEVVRRVRSALLSIRRRCYDVSGLFDSVAPKVTVVVTSRGGVRSKSVVHAKSDPYERQYWKCIHSELGKLHIDRAETLTRATRITSNQK